MPYIKVSSHSDASNYTFCHGDVDIPQVEHEAQPTLEPTPEPKPEPARLADEESFAGHRIGRGMDVMGMVWAAVFVEWFVRRFFRRGWRAGMLGYRN